MPSAFNYDHDMMVRCECSSRKNPRDVACPTCLDLDGRSAEEYDITSALRVMGGHATIAAIAEDIGDGDQNHRRTYRGLAKARASGHLSSVAEFPEPAVSAQADRWRALRDARKEKNRRRAARPNEGMKTVGGGAVTYSLKGGR